MVSEDDSRSFGRDPPHLHINQVSYHSAESTEETLHRCVIQWILSYSLENSVISWPFPLLSFLNLCLENVNKMCTMHAWKTGKFRRDQFKYFRWGHSSEKTLWILTIFTLLLNGLESDSCEYVNMRICGNIWMRFSKKQVPTVVHTVYITHDYMSRLYVWSNTNMLYPTTQYSTQYNHCYICEFAWTVNCVEMIKLTSC